MPIMQLIAVTEKSQEKEFIKVNTELNGQIRAYIRPIDKEIDEVFDPKQNKAFRHGEISRWILKDEEGRLMGRIAAFVSKKYKNKGDDGPVGGIGFFDCIDDQQAADMLFDVARHWLLQRGMTAMDGPINFGERDKWWGLVTEGFHEPMYGMNFNPPYYQRLFENYGFRPFFHQLCFGMDQKRPLNAKIMSRHAALASDPAYKARHIEKKHLEKFARDFTVIYNKAYAGHGGLKEMKYEQSLALFKKMKPLMDEKIVWFVYHNDQPIAMFLNIPDLNQYFKHFNGKFGLWQKLYFLWLRSRNACRKFTGLVFALVPEFQGKGVDAYMIAEAAKVVQPMEIYDEYEMQWIGDFNPKMVNIAKNLGDTHISRKLTTYRYLFDRTAEFKRHPILA
ncbi:MAG TPA: hypothetical protein VK563_16610 [Puia sp.]|nr:hypothetical protein [Puia sp.]